MTATGSIVTAAPTEACGTQESGSVVAEVLAATVKRWPTLSIADLGSVREWVLNHQPCPADALICHLCSDDLDDDHRLGGLAADPRVHLAIRMAAPIKSGTTCDHADGAPPPRQPGTAPQIVAFPTGGQAAQAGYWVDAPHELIGSTLSDGAVQVWLVLGSVPAVDAGFRSVAPTWIARRAGWDCDTSAAERRVRRATTELADQGWLALDRESLGGGRSRPTYHRLRQPRRAGYERVSLDILQLRPSLLRSWLRWSTVMGHREETRLTIRELAGRWQLSDKQLRRQLAALVEEGLLAQDNSSGRIIKLRPPAGHGDYDVPHLADPTGSEAAAGLTAEGDGFQAALPLAIGGGSDHSHRTQPDTSPAPDDRATGHRSPVDNPPDKNVPPHPDGTFLSGGMGHFCPPKEVHTGERHTLLGTSVPNVEDLRTREAATDRQSAALQQTAGPPAAEPPPRRPSRRESHPAALAEPPADGGPRGDIADQQARRILRRFLWLRRAPDPVPHMIRAVLAAQIRRGLTAEEITGAIAERITPADVIDGGHVAAVRDVLRGVWADRKAANQNPPADPVHRPHPPTDLPAAAANAPEWDDIVTAGPAGPGMAAMEWLEAVFAPSPDTREPDLNAGTEEISTWLTRAILPGVLESPTVTREDAPGSVNAAIIRCFHQQTTEVASRYQNQPAVVAAQERSLHHVEIAFGPDRSQDRAGNTSPGASV